MRSPVATATAIALGIIVLLGYFLPAGWPGALPVRQIRTLILGLGVTLAGFAALVSIFALVRLHWRKLLAAQNGDPYSIFLVVGFGVAFGLGVYAYGWNPLVVPAYQQFINAVQIPVEASLMAALAVTLTLALARLFQRRRGILPVTFFVSVVLFLVLNSGLFASQPELPGVAEGLAVLQFLPVAGARGLLIGIAIGSLIAGLRVLSGAERPYSG